MFLPVCISVRVSFLPLKAAVCGEELGFLLPGPRVTVSSLSWPARGAPTRGSEQSEAAILWERRGFVVAQR